MMTLEVNHFSYAPVVKSVNYFTLNIRQHIVHTVTRGEVISHNAYPLLPTDLSRQLIH